MFLTPRLLERLAASGLHAVVQPPFLHSQGADLGALPLPPGLSLMPFRSMLDAGIPLAFSSDYPVADPDPLLGIRSAVTRLAANGSPVVPEQAVTPEQALHAYTLGAARSMGVGHLTGTIEAGKQADMVLLDSDPFITAREPKVLRTWRAGRLVYSAGMSAGA